MSKVSASQAASTSASVRPRGIVALSIARVALDSRPWSMSFTCGVTMPDGVTSSAVRPVQRRPSMPQPRALRRFAPLLLLVACGDESAPPASADDTTGDAEGTTVVATESGESGAPAVAGYFENIKPILDGRCVMCHHDGGIAPFSLETYDDAAQWAASAQSAI